MVKRRVQLPHPLLPMQDLFNVFVFLCTSEPKMRWVMLPASEGNRSGTERKDMFSVQHGRGRSTKHKNHFMPGVKDGKRFYELTD
jgi:hypothetical protein